MISLALADLAVLALGVVFGDALNPLDEKLTREVIFEQNTWSCLFYVLNSKHVTCSPNDKSDSFILGYISPLKPSKLIITVLSMVYLYLDSLDNSLGPIVTWWRFGHELSHGVLWPLTRKS